MAGKVKFDTEAVRKLVEHSLAHPEMMPTYSHLTNKKNWKPGTVPDQHGYAKTEDVDTSKIEPYIMLVKDSGIYLMVGSKEKMAGVETLNHVVYGEGFGPNDDYDEMVRVAGGDDFGEALPLEWFSEAMKSDAKTFALALTSRSIKMLVTPASSAQKPKP